LKIEGTNNTPKISLNWDLNYLVIEGVSFPEDAEKFYKPLLLELETNAIMDPRGLGTMNIKIQLEYFNTVSAKMLFKILRVFDRLVDNNEGIEINLIWEYEYDDLDLLEAGEDYESMFSNIQFKFDEKESKNEDE
tara:strand:- start:262 stop:666 length:405 start_codon:yes stop_codon:yes gene_type:complete